MKIISDSIKEIQNLPFERLYGFSKGGAKMFIKEGDEDEVRLTSDEFRKLKGKIVVHNHPDCKGDICGLTEFDIESTNEHRFFQVISVCSCGNVDSYTR